MAAREREELEEILGYTFAHPERLDRALTHRSNRQGIAGDDNERLEFLGDRVLGLVASERFYRSFPDWDAGKLSKALARVVSTSAVCAAAQQLGLGEYLRLGAGEEKSGGREKKRLLADAYEAVAGAIYLDAGLEAAASFVNRTLVEPALLGKVEGLGLPDHKSALQEWLQRRGLAGVEYRVRNETGPDHRKTFEVEAWQAGRMLASSVGASKKEAEQGSAMLALERLSASPELDGIER